MQTQRCAAESTHFGFEGPGGRRLPRHTLEQARHKEDLFLNSKHEAPSSMGELWTGRSAQQGPKASRKHSKEGKTTEEELLKPLSEIPKHIEQARAPIGRELERRHAPTVACGRTEKLGRPTTNHRRLQRARATYGSSARYTCRPRMFLDSARRLPHPRIEEVGLYLAQQK